MFLWEASTKWLDSLSLDLDVWLAEVDEVTEVLRLIEEAPWKCCEDRLLIIWVLESMVVEVSA
jgi:hypothetical protein